LLYALFAIAAAAPISDAFAALSAISAAFVLFSGADAGHVA